jgi:hypothetical protein
MPDTGVVAAYVAMVWAIDVLRSSPDNLTALRGVGYNPATAVFAISGGVSETDVDYPKQVVNVVPGMDGGVIGGGRQPVDCLISVQTIGDTTDLEQIMPAAKKADYLLHNRRGSQGVTAQGIVLACTREREILHQRVDGDKQFWHMGGIYRCRVLGT